MLRFIALQGYRAHENVEHSQRRENVIYRDRSRAVEPSLQLENKQQIMQSRFTCIVTLTGVRRNLNAMKHSIELCLYRDRKHLWIVFSFKTLKHSQKRKDVCWWNHPLNYSPPPQEHCPTRLIAVTLTVTFSLLHIDVELVLLVASHVSVTHVEDGVVVVTWGGGHKV